MTEINQSMTPKEIVSELDNYIVGQHEYNELSPLSWNRWRRSQVSEELRKEITPKNILMIGPTGCGKTENSQDVLADLADALFLKVEATKFTEVGYVGRDVESIVRDLMDISIKMTREREMRKVTSLAEEAAEERILDILVPNAHGEFEGEENDEPKEKESATRQLYRKKFREGQLDDKEIEINISKRVVTDLKLWALPAWKKWSGNCKA